jgi:hypothetical protein
MYRFDTPPPNPLFRRHNNRLSFLPPLDNRAAVDYNGSWKWKYVTSGGKGRPLSPIVLVSE